MLLVCVVLVSSWSYDLLVSVYVTWDQLFGQLWNKETMIFFFVFVNYGKLILTKQAKKILSAQMRQEKILRALTKLDIRRSWLCRQNRRNQALGNSKKIWSKENFGGTDKTYQNILNILKKKSTKWGVESPDKIQTHLRKKLSGIHCSWTGQVSFISPQ